MREYLRFKHSLLELNGYEIYNLANDIVFYEKIVDYIQNIDIEENELKKIKSLRHMLDFYKTEGINTLGNYEAIESFLNNYIREIMTKLTIEYLKFKESILTLNKEEIFERAFKISFYNEIYKYLKNNNIHLKTNLSNLYISYIKYENINITSDEDKAEFINIYDR